MTAEEMYISGRYPRDTKIINFKEGLQHKVSEVICIKCAKRWIAVRPYSTLLKELECAHCGKGYCIETGEIIETD